MKNNIFLIIILITYNMYAQNNSEYTFGKLTDKDLALKKYELDTTAKAVVLLDLGTTTFVNVTDELAQKKYIRVNTKYYKKIKLFKKEAFKYATITIPLRNQSKIKDIRAVTHNNYDKTYLNEKLIYEEKVSNNRREIKFTLPNLKEGSIIEVEFTVQTPIKFNLVSWVFQSSIPTKFSQFKASIPGNFVFNRKLSGYLKLKTNTSTIKRNCFVLSEFERASSCEVVTYAMENIPAFIEEKYMTNKANFISKVKFELAYFQKINGTKQKYTTTWKAVDKEFKNNPNIGGQIKKYKYFENKIPSKIKLIPNKLNKAKAIYNFIQNHFNWDKYIGINNEIDCKKAFETKVGNVGEINISLINAMKALELNAELMLISTRDNGLPTKLYPVISDFNYFIVKLTIDNKTYLLDATDKLVPFGLLPFRCLNGYGRVLNFKDPSYWLDIIPEKNSKTQLSASLQLNDDGTIIGKLRKASFGYEAIFRRKQLLNKSEDDIMSEFESQFNTLEVVNYNVNSKNEINNPLIETFEVLIENDEDFTTYYLNPFFSEKIKSNPFKLDNRLYPVDFGFPRKYIVNFSLDVSENYAIASIPKSKALTLLKNSGSFKLITQQNGTKVMLNSTFKINKPIFYNSEYETLKILYNQVIKSQKEPISLIKN
ncbi:MAG: DUF3857 domain-containing protein [Lutibacter sp.]|uniref:hypothetical protein n=1 Tax=Lutibacter sp. TaxID=1925666 RepID=UPI00385D0C66